MSNNVFSESYGFYEITWKVPVQTDRQQTTVKYGA